jgi:UDP-2-acetamido-2,6-beta-L-arabino-hexul-4-ose reductase
MKNILITGSGGFIGKNLLYRLKELNRYNIFEYDINNSEDELNFFLNNSEVIFHLAGVNRPKDITEFSEVNYGLTKNIVSVLKKSGKRPQIIFTSSIQAEFDNPYGKSKREAESVLEDVSELSNLKVDVLRLPNVFGKWARPNYNSAVATFCYNTAHNLPIEIHDKTKEVSLVYIDDVIEKFISLLDDTAPGFNYSEVEQVYKLTVGELAGIINSFQEIRRDLFIPSFENLLVKKLYSTYLSYLPLNTIAIPAAMRFDDRGSLTELIKSQNFGQIFVSTTKPGIMRGNHYHHTKTEKFIVVKGEAEINFRRIDEDNIYSIKVSGDNIMIVDIPPGYTHNIVNTGESELIVLFWANEIFNQSKPDTNFIKV